MKREYEKQNNARERQIAVISAVSSQNPAYEKNFTNALVEAMHSCINDAPEDESHIWLDKLVDKINDEMPPQQEAKKFGIYTTPYFFRNPKFKSDPQENRGDSITNETTQKPPDENEEIGSPIILIFVLIIIIPILAIIINTNDLCYNKKISDLMSDAKKHRFDKNYEMAIILYNSVLKCRPKKKEAYYYRGLSYRKEKKI